MDDNSTTDTTDALPIQESSTNKINQTNSSITTQPTTSLLTGKKAEIIFSRFSISIHFS